ncbi:Cytochrome c6 [Calidithermus terrae]|uniref:Cytochrome c6 n=1 Tax=Calidithermus terrae TaxID=1408545 RepID=A0A399EXU6_9DEIN|nr:c-type cytochrome [Calidithermus terrae]RIH89394.1 Cytochrome c6 [Calidithermus terrae]
MHTGVRFKRLVVLGVVCSSLLPGVTAFNAQEPGVLVAQSPTHGSYLTDAQGRSLYLFTNDGKNTSNCYDQCAQNWPPLLVKDKPVAGKGVAASLLGTAQRKDGALQVTYNGWPLYYYARDQKPGDATGQGVGGVWFLVSPYGVAIKPPQQSQAAAPAAPEPMAAAAQNPEFMKAGEAVFKANCAMCHGEQGRGNPALAENRKLQDTDFVVRQVLKGSRYMPAFEGKLSDREAAAVITFIRNSWGNSYGTITEEMVKARR